jgi:hypothetical protein
MDVSAYGSTQQMQTQMRKMDGSGGGQGQGGGGMQEIMQSLSSEDRTAMQEQLSSMSQEDRVSTVSQMKEVDATSMTSEDYTQSILDILNQDTSSEDYTSTVFGFSTYA